MMQSALCPTTPSCFINPRASGSPWAWKQGGPDNPKARRRTARLFKIFVVICGVGSSSLREIDARSWLRHRAHWWCQGPQFTRACCVSYVCILIGSRRELTKSAWKWKYEWWQRKNGSEKWDMIKNVQRLLCIKTSVCVWKRPCVKTPLFKRVCV